MRQTINDTSAEVIEAEARRLLREQLLQSAWYRNMTAAKRKAQIDRDVERYWHLKVTEAAKQVLERVS